MAHKSPLSVSASCRVAEGVGPFGRFFIACSECPQGYWEQADGNPVVFSRRSHALNAVCAHERLDHTGMRGPGG
jgi:hypothetical protein